MTLAEKFLFKIKITPYILQGNKYEQQIIHIS